MTGTATKTLHLSEGKKIYLASDFHLGFPNREMSLERERKVVRWLNEASRDAAHIFLVGDIFDFWFEYKHVVPKGFVRLLGKIAELTDSGIKVSFFTGNHDLWMRNYFEKELNVQIYHKPQKFVWNGKKVLLGHGDALGPKDTAYKILKKYIFTNRALYFIFRNFLHPDYSFDFAFWWSNRRKSDVKRSEKERFKGKKDEWLWQYCLRKESLEHHDYYIFGHRHLPLDMQVNAHARYINLGEWLNFYTYAVFDGKNLNLKHFKV